MSRPTAGKHPRRSITGTKNIGTTTDKQIVPSQLRGGGMGLEQQLLTVIERQNEMQIRTMEMMQSIQESMTNTAKALIDHTTQSEKRMLALIDAKISSGVSTVRRTNQSTQKRVVALACPVSPSKDMFLRYLFAIGCSSFHGISLCHFVNVPVSGSSDPEKPIVMVILLKEVRAFIMSMFVMTEGAFTTKCGKLSEIQHYLQDLTCESIQSDHALLSTILRDKHRFCSGSLYQPSSREWGNVICLDVNKVLRYINGFMIRHKDEFKMEIRIKDKNIHIHGPEKAKSRPMDCRYCCKQKASHGSYANIPGVFRLGLRKSSYSLFVDPTEYGVRMNPSIDGIFSADHISNICKPHNASKSYLHHFNPEICKDTISVSKFVSEKYSGTDVDTNLTGPEFSDLCIKQCASNVFGFVLFHLVNNAPRYKSVDGICIDNSESSKTGAKRRITTCIKMMKTCGYAIPLDFFSSICKTLGYFEVFDSTEQADIDLTSIWDSTRVYKSNAVPHFSWNASIIKHVMELHPFSLLIEKAKEKNGGSLNVDNPNDFVNLQEVVLASFDNEEDDDDGNDNNEDDYEDEEDLTEDSSESELDSSESDFVDSSLALLPTNTSTTTTTKCTTSTTNKKRKRQHCNNSMVMKKTKTMKEPIGSLEIVQIDDVDDLIDDKSTEDSFNILCDDLAKSDQFDDDNTLNVVDILGSNK